MKIFKMVIGLMALGLVRMALFDTNNNMDISMFDFGKSIEQIIQDAGFEGETHYAWTIDGYKLTMHRIQAPKQYRNNKVVLFTHQMDGSSMDYLMNSEQESMAFQLARNGFDVWLLNNRGNFYSFEGKNINSDNFNYWNFGPEDMGYKDLPAAIDYILKITKEKKVTLVGMDQGSQILMIGASMNPKYFNSVINFHISISPRTDIFDFITAQFFGVIWNIWSVFQMAIQGIGLYKVQSRNQQYNEAMNCAQDINTCTHKYIGTLAIERYPYYLAHRASGLSWRTIQHNAQIAWEGKFQRWNFGILENLLSYDQLSPPIYDLGNIKFPVAVLYQADQNAGNVEKYLLMPQSSKLQTVVYSKKFDMSYESFFLGQDQSWFSNDLVPLISKYSSLGPEREST